jgi:hypothetical protein
LNVALQSPLLHVIFIGVVAFELINTTLEFVLIPLPYPSFGVTEQSHCSPGDVSLFIT